MTPAGLRVPAGIVGAEVVCGAVDDTPATQNVPRESFVAAVAISSPAPPR